MKSMNQLTKVSRCHSYHAREVAVHRAEVEDASVVLGSATPSMEAMYRARLGEYQLYEMKNRSHMQQMATVYTVDMRKELKNGNRSILSEKSAGTDRRQIECKRADHAVFESQRIFWFYFLQRMWSCSEMPAL